MPRQPLNYQQQACSCWITSVFNGLVYLLGNADKIPNIFARILYAMSSREGTYNEDAKYLITFITSHRALPIQCQIYEGQKVDGNLIKELLSANRVIVCDTLSGGHSVLLTKIEDDNILMFDPDWTNVTKNPVRVEGAFEASPEANYNVKVSLKHFESTDSKSRFSMGTVKSRFALAMWQEAQK